jgi:hypothetical protein
MLRALLYSLRRHPGEWLGRGAGTGGIGVVIGFGGGARTGGAALETALVPINAAAAPIAAARKFLRSIGLFISFRFGWRDGQTKLRVENPPPKTGADGTASHCSSIVAYTERKSVCHFRLPKSRSVKLG